MYLGIASIIALFILIILNVLRIPIKKRYGKKLPNVPVNLRLVEDRFLDTKVIDSDDNGKSTNKIFQTTGPINKIIHRYIIHQQKRNLSLIYEYGENVRCAKLLIYFYDEQKKLISTYRVIEKVTSNYSKPIAIPKNTTYVNFVEFDEEVENYYRQKFISERKLLIYDHISIFLLLFILSYWTVFIIGQNLLVFYFDLSGTLFNLILIGILTILNFVINLNRIQKRYP